MTYPNTNQEKAPLCYPLSMPVYGGRRRGTHVLGFRRKEGVGASGSLESLHVALAHVGGCGGRLGDTLPTSLA